MHDGDGCFDRRVAARYDESHAESFDRASVDPAVDFLADLRREAGVSLRERWSGWKREPFTSDSRAHVSVWEKPLATPRIAPGGA